MTLYTTTRTVRFQDIDAAGIVFYPQLFVYFHDAYMDFLIESGIDLPYLLDQGEYLLPLVHAEADFKRPLRFGDKIDVHLVRAKRQISSYAVYFSITKHGDERCLYCTGKAVHTPVKRATMTPTRDIPEPVRRVLQLSKEV